MQPAQQQASNSKIIQSYQQILTLYHLVKKTKDQNSRNQLKKQGNFNDDGLEDDRRIQMKQISLEEMQKQLSIWDDSNQENILVKYIYQLFDKCSSEEKYLPKIFIVLEHLLSYFHLQNRQYAIAWLTSALSILSAHRKLKQVSYYYVKYFQATLSQSMIPYTNQLLKNKFMKIYFEEYLFEHAFIYSQAIHNLEKNTAKKRQEEEQKQIVTDILLLEIGLDVLLNEGDIKLKQQRGTGINSFVDWLQQLIERTRQQKVAVQYPLSFIQNFQLLKDDAEFLNFIHPLYFFIPSHPSLSNLITLIDSFIGLDNPNHFSLLQATKKASYSFLVNSIQQQIFTHIEEDFVMKQKLQEVLRSFEGDSIYILIVGDVVPISYFQEFSIISKNKILHLDNNNQADNFLAQEGIQFLNYYLYSESIEQIDRKNIDKLRAVFTVNPNYSLNVDFQKSEKYFNVYGFPNHQKLLDQSKIQLKKLITHQMLTQETPNFSIISKDSNHFTSKRYMIFWLISPHNKRSSMQDFIQLLENKISSSEQLAVRVQDIKLSHLVQNYQIITLYSQQTFQFYKIINRGLRSLSNPLHTPYIRYFFGELFRAISRLSYQQFNKGFFSNDFICYRGCQLTPKQLNYLKENKNRYIQMQGFLSASMSDIQAKNFGDHLLTIRVRKMKKFGENTGGYCADISKFSKFEHEKQILFTPLNIFKILWYETDRGFVNIGLQLYQMAQEHEITDQIQLEMRRVITSAEKQKVYCCNQGHIFQLLGYPQNQLNYSLTKYKKNIKKRSINFRLQETPFIPIQFTKNRQVGQYFGHKCWKIIENIITLYFEELREIQNIEKLLVCEIFEDEEYEEESILKALLDYALADKDKNKIQENMENLLEIRINVLKQLKLKTKIRQDSVYEIDLRIFHLYHEICPFYATNQRFPILKQQIQEDIEAGNYQKDLKIYSIVEKIIEQFQFCAKVKSLDKTSDSFLDEINSQILNFKSKLGKSGHAITVILHLLKNKILYFQNHLKFKQIIECYSKEQLNLQRWMHDNPILTVKITQIYSQIEIACIHTKNEQVSHQILQKFKKIVLWYEELINNNMIDSKEVSNLQVIKEEYYRASVIHHLKIVCNFEKTKQICEKALEIKQLSTQSQKFFVGILSHVFVAQKNYTQALIYHQKQEKFSIKQQQTYLVSLLSDFQKAEILLQTEKYQQGVKILEKLAQTLPQNSDNLFLDTTHPSLFNGILDKIFKNLVLFGRIKLAIDLFVAINKLTLRIFSSHTTYWIDQCRYFNFVAQLGLWRLAEIIVYFGLQIFFTDAKNYKLSYPVPIICIKKIKECFLLYQQEKERCQACLFQIISTYIIIYFDLRNEQLIQSKTKKKDILKLLDTLLEDLSFWEKCSFIIRQLREFISQIQTTDQIIHGIGNCFAKMMIRKNLGIGIQLAKPVKDQKYLNLLCFGYLLNLQVENEEVEEESSYQKLALVKIQIQRLEDLIRKIEKFQKMQHIFCLEIKTLLEELMNYLPVFHEHEQDLMKQIRHMKGIVEESHQYKNYYILQNLNNFLQTLKKLHPFFTEKVHVIFQYIKQQRYKQMNLSLNLFLAENALQIYSNTNEQVQFLVSQKNHDSFDFQMNRKAILLRVSFAKKYIEEGALVLKKEAKTDFFKKIELLQEAYGGKEQKMQIK